MYSKTKYNVSFSLMTSFSLTIFGWDSFFRDCGFILISIFFSDLEIVCNLCVRRTIGV